jgi:aldose 1-epimerase
MKGHVEPPSGKQFEIRHGSQRAIIVEVGSGLREYQVDGKPVLDGYPVDRMADGGRGQPLLPWPNRLEDAQYEFGGHTQQLPIDEVSRNNASHGLTRWLNWNAVEHAADHIRLALIVRPRPGYPFTLGLQIEYVLDDTGLSVTTSATNLGREPLPFGAGQHAYFTVGTARVDEAVLRIPAAERLELDAERRLPTSRVFEVDNTEYDFRQGRSIGPLVLDDCYARLERDPDGKMRVNLGGPRSLTVWMDEHYKYVQVFSGDTLTPERRRQGLAIEPMTCPPNAFRSGTDLIVLEPRDSIRLEWGVEL